MAIGSKVKSRGLGDLARGIPMTIPYIDGTSVPLGLEITLVG